MRRSVRFNFQQKWRTKKEVAIDAAGNGNIEIQDSIRMLKFMQYTRGRRTLYLDPNQDLPCHSTVTTCGETQP